jgi:hypothetical protein
MARKTIVFVTFMLMFALLIAGGKEKTHMALTFKFVCDTPNVFVLLLCLHIISLDIYFVCIDMVEGLTCKETETSIGCGDTGGCMYY